MPTINICYFMCYKLYGDAAGNKSNKLIAVTYPINDYSTDFNKYNLIFIIKQIHAHYT